MSLLTVKEKIAAALATKPEYLGEEITLHGATDEVIAAAVKLDSLDVDSDGDEQPEQTGVFRVIPEDVPKVLIAKKATIRGHLFHINGTGTKRKGLVPFSVIRNTDENTHTNLFDLNEEQADWS